MENFEKGCVAVEQILKAKNEKNSIFCFRPDQNQFFPLWGLNVSLKQILISDFRTVNKKRNCKNFRSMCFLGLWKIKISMRVHHAIHFFGIKLEKLEKLDIIIKYIYIYFIPFKPKPATICTNFLNYCFNKRLIFR